MYMKPTSILALAMCRASFTIFSSLKFSDTAWTFRETLLVPSFSRVVNLWEVRGEQFDSLQSNIRDRTKTSNPCQHNYEKLQRREGRARILQLVGTINYTCKTFKLCFNEDMFYIDALINLFGTHLKFDGYNYLAASVRSSER